ncbi:MAG: CvpA family protein [Ardenticatenales bacterium]|nr:CvpA family protein [Ardenticatenales bacterium]
MINSYIDILLLLVIVYHVLRGWQNGFIIGFLDLLSWVGSLLAAFTFYDEVASWLGPTLGLSDAIARPIGFLATAILTGLLASLLWRFVLTRIPARSHTTDSNRFLGLLPGLVNGLLFAALLASLLLSLPLTGGLLVATRESALASRFASLTDRLEAELTPIVGDAISQTLNLTTIHPDSDEMVELPYKVSEAEAAPAPALEAQMLELINTERTRVGLPALEMDPELTEVARRHSADMFARGYFSHSTPEGLTPFDRIEAAGVRYLTAGENLAHAPTLTIAHNGLMNSPGHRENILRPEFGRVGIGILDGGSRGLMITQNFRD